MAAVRTEIPLPCAGREAAYAELIIEKNMESNMIALFREYMGTGLIVIWYLISLIYLWIKEKRKYMRILFLYMPLILLLLYFNPLFAQLVYKAVGDEIYYRILWLLPVTVVIAYTCVCVTGQIAQTKPAQGSFFHGRTGLLADAAALCMAGAVAVSGSLIYSSPLFSRAENLYHVPDSVVHICDAIQVPGREVMAAFPLELVPYVRQYSAFVCMPYGREMTVDRWNYHDPLSEALEQDPVDLETLVPLAREAACHYCILPAGRKLSGDPQAFGWVWFGEIDGYTVYRDPAIELWNPETGLFQ